MASRSDDKGGTGPNTSGKGAAGGPFGVRSAREQLAIVRPKQGRASPPSDAEQQLYATTAERCGSRSAPPMQGLLGTAEGAKPQLTAR